ncbi:hypothetical protein FA15DRAFT_672661 [Coprinopsis marcescibilis]|uniref:MYND-type domain-containing protein n=1 Tax=Coprinopsis marcescibilis TaxID=230819 RepID=A0A5C3KM96_COPMA|nr:hypothetical protein FA15DRAFT_672661 [Coprinopsis marcescibilis]
MRLRAEDVDFLANVKWTIEHGANKAIPGAIESGLGPLDHLPDLEHLRRQIPFALEHITFGLQCLALIHTYRDVLGRTLELNNAIFRTYHRHLTSIVTWATFIIRNIRLIWPTPTDDVHRAVLTVGLALHSLALGTSTYLLDSMIAEDTAVETMFAIIALKCNPWKPWDDAELYITLPNMSGNCPTLTLIDSCCSHDRVAMCEQFDKLIVKYGPEYAANVCENLLARLEFVDKPPYSTSQTPSRNLLYQRFRAVFGIVNCVRDYSQTKDFQRVWYKPETLTRVMAQMRTFKRMAISDRKQDNEAGAGSEFATATYGVWLGALRIEGRSMFFDAAITLFQKGLLHSVMDIMAFDGDLEVGVSTSDMIVALAIHTIFPKTCRALAKFIDGDYARRLRGRLEGVELEKWDTFCDQIHFLLPSASLRVLKGNHGYCSNIDCPNPSPSFVLFCSNCHMCSYCSRQCQKVDWAQRHRVECSEARIHYTDLKRRDIWTTRSMRRFYFSVIEQLFNREWPVTISGLTPMEFATQEPSILLFETTRFPIEARRVPVSHYPFKLPMFKSASYLNQRLLDYFGCLRGDTFPGTRVAEAKFDFADGVDLMVMVKLELEFKGPGEANLYRVKSGFIRIGKWVVEKDDVDEE